MKVNNKDYRTVWMEGSSVMMIEQNLLPFEFRIVECKHYKDTCLAIRNMVIRGAGAIGAAAGYAMAQAAQETPSQNAAGFLATARLEIESTRPTARNLFYAVERVYAAALQSPSLAIQEAETIADEDARASKKIGEFGADLIHDGYGIATHCNAGWLAFVDYGTALSPIYRSHEQGKHIMVYADETRPRGQGARLTAWELNNAGIPHVIIPDNATAWYMSQGKINLMIVGADRIAINGDTANKIGTLEKAIAARHYNIPFYVAAPTSTIDKNCPDGGHIVIEERSQDEVLYQEGLTADGRKVRILVCSPGSKALNPAFDVTPAGLITGFITEKGIVQSFSTLSDPPLSDADRSPK
jgi:methylthioribose-1-phosphate isomerase